MADLCHWYGRHRAATTNGGEVDWLRLIVHVKLLKEGIKGSCTSALHWHRDTNTHIYITGFEFMGSMAIIINDV